MSMTQRAVRVHGGPWQELHFQVPGHGYIGGMAMMGMGCSIVPMESLRVTEAGDDSETYTREENGELESSS